MSWRRTGQCRGGGMGRTVMMNLRIEWGDCDPAGIVYYPNFFHWFDVATWNFCAACGVPIGVLQQRYGILGLPLLEAKAAFKAPARPQDIMTIHTTLGALQRKAFQIRHLCFRGETALLEGQETRVWAHADARRPNGMRAAVIPAEVVASLTASGKRATLAARRSAVRRCRENPEQSGPRVIPRGS